VSANQDLTALLGPEKPTRLVYLHPDPDWRPPPAQPPG
jgi:hypothetical protein